MFKADENVTSIAKLQSPSTTMSLLRLTFWNISSLPISYLLEADLLGATADSLDTSLIPAENRLSSAPSDLHDTRNYLTLLAKSVMGRGVQGMSTAFLVGKVYLYYFYIPLELNFHRPPSPFQRRKGRMWRAHPSSRISLNLFHLTFFTMCRQVLANGGLQMQRGP